HRGGGERCPGQRPYGVHRRHPLLRLPRGRGHPGRHVRGHGSPQRGHHRGGSPMTARAEGPWALEVRNLTVAYRRRPALWDINLTVPGGRMVGIVGPNGAGKSTLIKAVLGLVPPASGTVLIYGRPYAEQRHLVGYVPQRESVDWDFPINV